MKLMFFISSTDNPKTFYVSRFAVRFVPVLTAVLGLLLQSSKLTNPQEADTELKHERAGRSSVSFKP